MKTIVLVALSLAGVSEYLAAADGDGLVVETQTCRLRFDAGQGLPREWSYKHAFEGSAEVEEIDLLGAEENGKHAISIIPGSQWLRDFLQEATFTHTIEDEDDVVRAVFVSQLSEQSSTSVRLTIAYTVPRNGTRTRISLKFDNDGGTPQSTSLELVFHQPLGSLPPERPGLFANLRRYRRTVAKQHGRVVELTEADSQGPIAWAGAHNAYFLTAVVPVQDGHSFVVPESAEAADGGTDESAASFSVSYQFDLDPGAAATHEFEFYGGPKTNEALGAELRGIRYAGIWNWLRQLCFGVEAILVGLHRGIGNWGVSLIGLAFVIRLILHPIFQVAITAQEKLHRDQRRIAPLIQTAKAEHKGSWVDREEAMRRIYKENNVSPFAPLVASLSLFVQVPAFIAVSTVMVQCFDLQRQSFLGIPDLSRPDGAWALTSSVPVLGNTLNALPFLMFAVQVGCGYLMASSTGDAQQIKQSRRANLFMAVLFFVLLFNFPSGMLVYWTVANVMATFHQRWIVSRLAPS